MITAPRRTRVVIALDDFHTRRGLGRAEVRREHVARRRAPRSLDDRHARRYLRAAEQRETAAASAGGLGRARAIRDRLLTEPPYHAGLRAAEVAAGRVAEATCWSYPR